MATIKELEIVEARKSIYYRSTSDLEEIKHALLWKQYTFEMALTDYVDFEKSPEIFLNSEDNIISYKNLVYNPVLYSINSLRRTYQNNRNFLKFKELDSLEHFLNVVEKINLVNVLQRYSSEKISFSNHINANDIDMFDLKYLFMSLHAVEKDMRIAKEINETKFLELKPICKDTRNEGYISSCI